MLADLKEQLKKSRWLNPLSHHVYYQYLLWRDKRRDRDAEDGKKMKRRQALSKKIYKQVSHKESEENREKKRQIWTFNAGNSFTGNPKWLFIYVNNYRKDDIDAYWLCSNDQTVRYVRRLGYKAFSFKSAAGIALQKKTHVYVVEQVKESLPENMPDDVVYLNLFHGVGCKSIEKRLKYGYLVERVAKKYIRYNDFCQKHMLFLVTSELMEKHFKEQLGLRNDMIIRAGYPRCLYQKQYKPIATFDHDILKQKGLPAGTKIAAYVPTFRDNDKYDFWAHAVPDFEMLIDVLRRNNLLLIIKMHPLMENNPHYIFVKEKYKDEPRLLFWDNQLDIYEIFSNIDVGIIDYSSIFYDMLAGGVKHFIRYFFDYNNKENMRDPVFDPKEMTCGRICETFSDLLKALETYESDPADDQKRIFDLFWSYSDEQSMDRIVDAARSYHPRNDLTLPTLYSFDIFDTLIARSTSDPVSVFYYVQEKMEESGESFPAYLKNRYPSVRSACESDMRELVNKKNPNAASECLEISFDSIFQKMQGHYGLSDRQVELLKEWELEAEYRVSIPIRKRIDHVLELLDRGETVVLISDMYLPEEFVRRLLVKAEPRLGEVPLFLSSSYGVRKVKRQLFIKAYLSFDNYNFSSWIHYGDNPEGDGRFPGELGITPVLHQTPVFNEYEQELADTVSTFDGFLVAAAMQRFRNQCADPYAYFSFAVASLYFVPYISWVVRDAERRGIRKLYFISRDGFYLKLIADEIIRVRGKSIETAYIYGSRRAWRVPSFIDGEDEEFFSTFGNMAGVDSRKKLVQALLLDDEKFDTFFPGLKYLKSIRKISPEMLKSIVGVVSSNDDYRAYLRDTAAEARPIVEKYIQQTTDFSERSAYVEYWGRGYTQSCYARLLRHASGMNNLEVPYYYVRSIYPGEEGLPRWNFSVNQKRFVFAEPLFANLPYKSIESYKEGSDGWVVPVIVPAENNMALHEAMAVYLPAFAREYARLDTLDAEKLDQDLFDFSIQYFDNHQRDQLIAQTFGSLKYAEGMFGSKKEYAPSATRKMIREIESGTSVRNVTLSKEMTMARSSSVMAKKFENLAVTLPEVRKKDKAYKAALDVEKKQLEKDSSTVIRELRMLSDRKKPLQETYNELARKRPLRSKLVMITPPGGEADSLWSLKRYLSGRSDILAEELTLTDSSAELPETIVDARCIVVTRPYTLFSTIRMREGCRLCYFPENAVQMHLETEKTYSEQVWSDYLKNNRFDYITVPGGVVREQMTADLKGMTESVVPLGSPATDVFFSQEFHAQAKKQIHQLLPGSVRRKIILYLPDSDKEKEGSGALDADSCKMLMDVLGDEYLLLVYRAQKEGRPPMSMVSDAKRRVQDITGQCSVRAAMVCADILLGDGTDVFWEGLLLNKPMYLVQNHLMENERRKEIIKQAVSSVRVVSDVYRLASELQKEDGNKEIQTDRQQEKSVSDLYFGYCKGKSAQSIVELIFPAEK